MMVTNGLEAARTRRSVCACAVEAELPVNAADDEIEAAQHVVGIVERAVRKDIGLDALEDAEAAAERRVEAVDLSLLLLDFLDA